MDDGDAMTMPPLAVDLDRTLLLTDSLVEQVLTVLFRHPRAAFGALTGLFHGRAELKRRVTTVAAVTAAELVFDDELIGYLRKEKDNGRALHLVTAADQRIADLVAGATGLFDSATGSKDGLNLKGANKLAHLERRFPGGFSYAGDSPADLVIWQGARSAVLVGVGGRVRQAVADMGVRIEADISRERPRLGDWLSLMRVHQWSKNALIFVPFILSQRFDDLAAIFSLLVGFLALSLAASGTYILNDIADIGADRAHRSKRFRPIARGLIDAGQAFVVAIALVVAGLLLAASQSLVAAGLILVYLAGSLAYSFALKRLAMVDIFVLGGLYTMRMVIGTALVGVAFSHWLLMFSFVFFFSLSMAKRHVEIVNAARSRPAGEDPWIKGRGYRTSDAPLTLSMGVGTTLLSVLVLSLYVVTDVYPHGIYRQPEWLWATVLLVMAWTSRIWLLSHRGELDDDPVAFALRDPASLVMGAGAGAALLLAAT
jgi:4-hydroxybenzoate polyprenyltransferase